MSNLYYIILFCFVLYCIVSHSFLIFSLAPTQSYPLSFQIIQNIKYIFFFIKHFVEKCCWVNKENLVNFKKGIQMGLLSFQWF